MSPKWIAAAIVASLSAFAIAHAVASQSAETPPIAKPGQRISNLNPAPPPSSWHTVRVPGSPAVLAYPGSWRAISGDPGTASAALLKRGRVVGYLNATPQGGEETPANWLGFRPDHNREEGDLDLTPLAGGRGLHFPTGTGSCLIDDYATEAGAHFRELACIVAGRDATTVIVGSAPPRRWSQMAPVLRRAVSSFTT